jgi:hypothetical protein
MMARCSAPSDGDHHERPDQHPGRDPERERPGLGTARRGSNASRPSIGSVDRLGGRSLWGRQCPQEGPAVPISVILAPANCPVVERVLPLLARHT